MSHIPLSAVPYPGLPRLIAVYSRSFRFPSPLGRRLRSGSLRFPSPPAKGSIRAHCGSHHAPGRGAGLVHGRAGPSIWRGFRPEGLGGRVGVPASINASSRRRCSGVKEDSGRARRARLLRVLWGEPGHGTRPLVGPPAAAGRSGPWSRPRRLRSRLGRSPSRTCVQSTHRATYHAEGRSSCRSSSSGRALSTRQRRPQSGQVTTKGRDAFGEVRAMTQ